MDKFKVSVRPNSDGTWIPEDKLLEEATKAGWSEDPGTGSAILIDDERGAPGYEVLNPIPFAPPIGWEPTPPIDQLIRDRVRAEMLALKDDDEIDDIVDAEDFDVPDELPELSTIYEFVGMEEQYPAVPPNVKDLPVTERIKNDLDYEEAKELERKARAKRSRAEYERRQKEHEELYGPSKAVRDALSRRPDEDGAP